MAVAANLVFVELGVMAELESFFDECWNFNLERRNNNQQRKNIYIIYY